MAGKKITGRTKQLSLKSTPEFHQRLKVLASKEKCLMIEILEQAVELFERERKLRKDKKDDDQRSKENTTPNVSPIEISEGRVEKRPLSSQGTESSSKKRKISDY